MDNTIGHKRHHLNVAATPLAFNAPQPPPTEAELEYAVAAIGKLSELLRPHGRDPLAAARREGVIEGLVIALQILDADHPGESQRIAAEIERLRGEA